MRGLRYAWVTAALAVVGMVATPGRAGVSTTGDTYDASYFYVGFNSNKSGTLKIDAGSAFSRSGGYLGYGGGATGTAVITGTGSNWTNSGILTVGNFGSGTLRVEAGGQVGNTSGYLGYFSGSAGEAIITGAGSKWANSETLYVGYNLGSGKLTVSDGGAVSAKALYASLSDLYGDGTISIQNGGVLDADLVFDSSHGLTQSLAFGSGGTLQFGVDGTSNLGVGYRRSGSLRIAEGSTVNSNIGYLGYYAGATGTAVISGGGSTWTTSSDLRVGTSGMGTLRVEGGGRVSIPYSSLGYYPGSAGEAIITGAGSKWTNSGKLYVGSSGSGTVRVEAGGQVSSASGYLGFNSGSTGEVIVTGAGSTWTSSENLFVGYSGSGKLTVSDGGVVSAKTLHASLGDLYGNGTITVSGAVLDADLVFDATHGLAQTLGFGSGGKIPLNVDGTGALGAGYEHTGSLRIAEGRSVASAGGSLGFRPGSTGAAIVTGTGSTWTSSGELTVGNLGKGTLRVEGGGEVSDSSGSLARNGSTGTAIITGAGSKWTHSGALYVGHWGSGTLRVEDGGLVSNTDGYLGYEAGSAGLAIVTGAGSKWANSGDLWVGHSHPGTLTVSDGGQVTARRLNVDPQGTVRLLVSGDRMMVLGNALVPGQVQNSGKFVLQADAFLPAGTYRPVGEYADRSLFWWDSGGSTLAVGGTWNSSAKTFTVVAPALIDAGTPVQVAAGMRLLISDLGSGERAGVSFGALNTGTAMAAPAMLRGMPLTQDERAGLLAMLDSGERVLSGWDFAGQLAGGEALVSFDVGLGAEGVRVWRLSQNGWSEYTAEMMTYDAKGIVSFTVDPASFNGGGYAVSGVVPEPGALGLVAMAAGTLLGRRRGRAVVRG